MKCCAGKCENRDEDGSGWYLNVVSAEGGIVTPSWICYPCMRDLRQYGPITSLVDAGFYNSKLGVPHQVDEHQLWHHGRLCSSFRELRHALSAVNPVDGMEIRHKGKITHKYHDVSESWCEFRLYQHWHAGNMRREYADLESALNCGGVQGSVLKYNGKVTHKWVLNLWVSTDVATGRNPCAEIVLDGPQECVLGNYYEMYRDEQCMNRYDTLEDAIKCCPMRTGDYTIVHKGLVVRNYEDGRWVEPGIKTLIQIRDELCRRLRLEPTITSECIVYKALQEAALPDTNEIFRLRDERDDARKKLEELKRQVHTAVHEYAPTACIDDRDHVVYLGAILKDFLAMLRKFETGNRATLERTREIGDAHHWLNRFLEVDGKVKNGKKIEEWEPIRGAIKRLSDGQHGSTWLQLLQRIIEDVDNRKEKINSLNGTIQAQIEKLSEQTTKINEQKHKIVLQAGVIREQTDPETNIYVCRKVGSVWTKWGSCYASLLDALNAKPDPKFPGTITVHGEIKYLWTNGSWKEATDDSDF